MAGSRSPSVGTFTLIDRIGLRFRARRPTPGGHGETPGHISWKLGAPVTETRTDNVTWLTQEAYDRLKGELEYLSGPGRKEIAAKIEAAREEGDLKENGGYRAAKEEQGKM